MARFNDFGVRVGMFWAHPRFALGPLPEAGSAAVEDPVTVAKVGEHADPMDVLQSVHTPPPLPVERTGMELVRGEGEEAGPSHFSMSWPLVCEAFAPQVYFQCQPHSQMACTGYKVNLSVDVPPCVVCACMCACVCTAHTSACHRRTPTTCPPPHGRVSVRCGGVAGGTPASAWMGGEGANIQGVVPHRRDSSRLVVRQPPGLLPRCRGSGRHHPPARAKGPPALG